MGASGLLGTVTVSGVIETLVIGLLVGAVYGLFSTGLSLVFGVMRLANFAYGDLVMLGMYGGYVFQERTGLSIYASLPIVVVSALVLGVAIYWVCFKGSEKPGASHSQLIIALGLSIVLETVAQEIFGPNPKTVNPGGAIVVGPVTIPTAQLIAFCAAVVLVAGLQLVLARTQLGRALRAIVLDREMARLVGIRPDRLFPLAFAGSTALAGIAGVVLVGFYPVTPVAGSTFILIAFVCVILGGAGDTVGAFLAGLLVGIIESLTATYWRSDLQDVPVYVLFIAVLFFRPNGLLGRGVEAPL